MDLLQFAISMEQDLEDFYKEQAKVNENNSLHAVFTMLANEEENHKKILLSYQDKLTLSLEDSGILSKVTSIFKDLQPFVSDIRELPNQLEVYQLALEKEEESLKFFQNMYNDATEEEAKELFTHLIKQEETHSIILEELIKLVKRPEEWTESADFGIREDY